MSDPVCPLCDPPENCKGYPHLWKRLRENPAKWQAVHDQVNNPSPALPPAPVKASAYPSLTQQAWNAGKAVAAVATSGFAVVSQEEQARRLAICHECEFYDPQQIRCRKCACRLNLKTRLEAWHCPIDKW